MQELNGTWWVPAISIAALAVALLAGTLLARWVKRR